MRSVQFGGSSIRAWSLVLMAVGLLVVDVLAGGKRKDDPGHKLNWQFVSPGRYKSLELTESGAVALMSTNYDTLGVHVFDPEVKEGYTRYDLQSGTAFQASGYYVVTKQAKSSELIYLRMGMENSQKRPNEHGLEDSDQSTACLCYESTDTAGKDMLEQCGEAGKDSNWGVVCLKGKVGEGDVWGLQVQYRKPGAAQMVDLTPAHDTEPETGAGIQFSESAEPKAQVAYEKGGGNVSGLYEAETHFYSAANNEQGEELPPPKFVGRYIYGKEYPVKTLRILHNGKPFTMDYNGVFFGGELVKDTYDEVYNYFAQWTHNDPEIETPDCQPCQCKVPEPLGNETLQDAQGSELASGPDAPSSTVGLNVSLVVGMFALISALWL